MTTVSLTPAKGIFASAMHPIIEADVRAVVERTGAVWEGLRGANLFITGGTGFFGSWLLDTLAAANAMLSLGARATVLTRKPEVFARRSPHLASADFLTLLEGDVRNFPFPTDRFTHVIHAATESSTSLNADDPQAMFDVCVDGTRRVLALTERTGARRMLFTSSGAVYGRQPTDMAHVLEDYSGGPDTLDVCSAYAEGKRAAEHLCSLASARASGSGGPGIVIARCFAFVGPHLPLDAHFAIGNFIRDAASGTPIRIAGDGTPYRSYLYAADLAGWLYTLLMRGQPGRAYNVGSEEAVSIHDLAKRVSAVASEGASDDAAPPVIVAKQPTPGVPPARYVPSCHRAACELGLVPWTPLDEAIRRTLHWASSQRSPT